jgi:hypothetical protein
LQVTNYDLLQQFKIDDVIFYKCYVCNLIVHMDECLSMSSSRSQMCQALIMLKNRSSIENLSFELPDDKAHTLIHPIYGKISLKDQPHT